MKKRYKILFFLLTFVFLIYICLYGLKSYLDMKMKSKYSTKDLESLKELKTKHINVYHKSFQSSKPDESLKDFTKNFYDEFEKVSKDMYKLLSFNHNNPNSQDDKLNEFRKNYALYEPVIKAFKKLIDHPDYEIEALNCVANLSEVRGIPVPNFLSLQNNVKLLALEAEMFCEDGKFDKAFENAQYIIRAAKTDKYSLIISQLIGIAMLNIGSKSWYDSVTKCNDIKLIKETFDKQKQLKPTSGFFSRDINISISDNLGYIKIASRYGIKSNVDGMTGQEIQAERFRVEAEFLEKLVLPKINDSLRKQEIKQIIENNRIVCALAGGEPIGLKAILASIVGPFVRDSFTMAINPNQEEALTRDDISFTKYNLLMIETAKKLYALEHNKEIKSIAELVPDYLSEIPVDCFDKDGNLIKYEEEIYSVGPDKTDDKGQLLYDPTNGTISPGDIFF